MAISCQKRSPRFDKFPNVSYHFCVFHAIFIMTSAKFFTCMFVHFLCVFTTRKAQHNTHSVQYPQYTQHITSHHTTSHFALVWCSFWWSWRLFPAKPSWLGLFNEDEDGTMFGLFRFVFFVSWSWISVGLRGFRPCGGECLDPKDGELCLVRAHFRGGSQRY